MTDRREGRAVIDKCVYGFRAVVFATFVVEYHRFNWSAVDASGIICIVEGKLDGIRHFLAQRRGFATEGHANADLERLSGRCRLAAALHCTTSLGPPLS